MLKVLLVDDEPFVLEGLRIMIDWGKYGFSICGEATNGEDALEIIKAYNPQLVITDIRMPVTDGLQLIQTVYEAQELKTKFIILSGYDDFKYVKSAMRYEVSDYILKPLDGEELNHAVEKIAGQILKEWQLVELKTKKPAITAGTDDGAIHEVYKEKVPCHHFFDENIDLIMDEIKKNHADGIRKRVKNLFHFFSKNQTTPEVIKVYMENLELEVIRHVLDMDRDIAELSKEFITFNKFINKVAINTLRDDFTGLCIYVAHYINGVSKSNMKDIISQMKYYIKDYYHRDIKINTIAKQFYVNPVYLGRLFKKSTGMQFNEYLHTIRIEEAIKLLKRTNMKISDIAKSVGYHDTDYFSYKFKSITRSSPSELKNR